MIKTHALLMEKKGSGWTCVNVLQCKDSYSWGIDNKNKFTECLNQYPQQWQLCKNKILTDLEKRGNYCVSFVFEYNVVAPSEIYQIIFECPTVQVAENLKLEIQKRRYNITGELYPNVEWVENISAEMYKKLCEW